jgi:hypothetical protein
MLPLTWHEFHMKNEEVIDSQEELCSMDLVTGVGENKIYILTLVQDGRPVNLGFDSPQKLNIFSSTEPSTGWVPAAFSPWKTTWSEADNLHQSGAEIKSDGAVSPLPLRHDGVARN